MLCKIADLIVEVPSVGDLLPRCREYQWSGNEKIDFRIPAEPLPAETWPGLREDLRPYMDTGLWFAWSLLHHQGLMLHASAVEMEGRAYLFSGPCGMGKSTHTRLWQQTFGEAAQVFNDDKPALRRLDDRWYAYGTPWCGKDGINQNKKVPLAGICFLQRGEENSIRRLNPAETVSRIMAQTTYRLQPESMELLLGHIDALAREIPIFELHSRPEPAAAQLSYETMRRAAEEADL